MVQRIVDIKTDGMAVFENESRRLILCLENCSMIAAMVDKSSNHWVAVEVLQCSEEDMEDTETLLQQLKQQSGLLQYTGLEIKIFIRTANAMPIPTALVSEATQLLHIQFGLQKKDMDITGQVNDEISVALKTNADWLSPFTQLFPQASLHTSLASLISQSLSESSSSDLPLLQLVFCHGLVELVLVKNNQLLMAKCFRFNAVEDMDYQLLNICRQLNIGTAEIAVKVQGLVAEGSPLHQSLLKYFADVQFAKPSTAGWGVAFKTIPDHYFTSLIHATL